MAIAKAAKAARRKEAKQKARRTPAHARLLQPYRSATRILVVVSIFYSVSNEKIILPCSWY